MAYDIDLRYLHYDITSVYFEGEYEESDKIDYGYSRDHRPDAKQVNLAANVTARQGFLWGIAFWQAAQPIAQCHWRT